MILASASALYISVAPEFSDKLLVTAVAGNGSTGILALNGGSVIFTRAAGRQRAPLWRDMANRLGTRRRRWHVRFGLKPGRGFSKPS